jgi:[ribosomal protein S5]-alanine N-acetyltransferase
LTTVNVVVETGTDRDYRLFRFNVPNYAPVTAMSDGARFPALTTERLHLRDVRASDAADVLVFRGDPIVQRFDDPPIHTLDEAAAFIGEVHEEIRTGEGIVWAVVLVAEETVVGLVGFHEWDRYHRRAEAGYGFARDYWGQGIASESLRAMFRFGFDEMDLNRVFARTIADNHESVRLLERLGFQREGTQRAHSFEDDGTFHDSAIYGLLADEFVP